MNVAIMQPYFLPYVGYFSLIAASDQFVVFDPVQYIRRGWVNRNRILKPGFRTDQYFAVPVAKHARNTLIRDVMISQNEDWRRRLLGQVDHYRSKAPFYAQAREILSDCLRIETDCLAELNVHCLKVICDAIEIEFRPIWFDRLKPPIDPPQHAGQWALNIADRLAASAYINPIGGRGIFRADEFAAKGIDLRFLSNSLTPYSQRNDGHFVPGLSIIDVLMFNSLADTKNKIVDDLVVTP